MDGEKQDSMMDCFRKNPHIDIRKIEKYYNKLGTEWIYKYEVFSPAQEKQIILFKTSIDNEEIRKNDDHLRLITDMLIVFRRISVKIVYTDIDWKKFKTKRKLSDGFHIGQYLQKFVSPLP